MLSIPDTELARRVLARIRPTGYLVGLNVPVDLRVRREWRVALGRRCVGV